MSADFSKPARELPSQSGTPLESPAAFSAPETLGIYRRWEIAMLFNSAFDARYFFSTDNLAAADGFVSTHLAAFSSARVAAAVAFGFLARNFPFTRTAQQYSSL